MDTCITVWHWPTQERWFDEGIRTSLDLVRHAGFTHINWNPDAGSSYWMADAEIEFTRRIVAEAGLKVHSVHATNGRNTVSELIGPVPFTFESRKDIRSPHEWQRLSGVELLKNRIDLAAAFGAPNIVLHVDISDGVFRSPESETEFFAPLYRSLDELLPYCLERKVQIAAETLLDASGGSFLKLYDRLFSRYEAAFIGLCYDSGHWELLEPGGLTVLERYGNRLIATHIHDNFGAKDNHLLPFDGRLDWNAITKAIAATDYVTPLNFETPMDRYGVPDAVFYHRAHAVAARLEEMIATARRKVGE
ncbi:sugar phosphate isomerase/epimerase [Sinorhizobium meliloti]|uniref:sugar phosphate isomerase/epimerase family protein n=1 Tax=Rhizobium meliloti TaxID=382 RepID=UPI000FD95F52|nr:sugar phosphate isomerase/epimerase family protein [Sinorhizobium meliloti]MDE3775659.1 sugar phosphate isomerase/epimerase [Sinorhizobium meliloti]RVK67027.1 sugar phosphate isomerase/epimerase [Sinorhizobium meliloti]